VHENQQLITFKATHKYYGEQCPRTPSRFPFIVHKVFTSHHRRESTFKRVIKKIRKM
jgi:hypothetical protein